MPITYLILKNAGELSHVFVLFWIYGVIRETNIQVSNLESKSWLDESTPYFILALLIINNARNQTIIFIRHK